MIRKHPTKVVFLFSAIPCQWGSWKPIGNCSQPCGNGTQNFTREKTVIEQYGGECDNIYEKQEGCHIKPCPGTLIF